MKLYTNLNFSNILQIKKIYNIKKGRKLFKMNDTVIYLIRHADTVEENGIRNTNEIIRNIKVRYGLRVG